MQCPSAIDRRWWSICNRSWAARGFEALISSDELEHGKPAPDIYLEMMPFTYANKINEPILLIHGMADNNSGTFPIQSERMYVALKGHGATVEYVQLPNESHGYSARESVMDVVARMSASSAREASAIGITSPTMR